MDPTLMSTLLTVGGLIVGYLVRHFQGGSASATPAPAVSAPTAAAANTHPILAAITNEFENVVVSMAKNFASNALQLPGQSNATQTPAAPKS